MEACFVYFMPLNVLDSGQGVMLHLVLFCTFVVCVCLFVCL